jgi:hypothetical protein
MAEILCVTGPHDGMTFDFDPHDGGDQIDFPGPRGPIRYALRHMLPDGRAIYAPPAATEQQIRQALYEALHAY